MATFRQVQLKATGTLPSTSTVKTKSIEFRRSDSSSSVEAEDACNKGKHSAPISALIIPSNPEERKYKERIGDGSSPVEPLCLPFVLVTAQQQQQQQETNEEQENAIRELQENFNMTDFRAKLRVAEALAQASDMTSPAARRRLEARKIEMDLTQDQHEGSKVPPPVFLNDQNEEYTPPRELLIYIMRMGSFNSAPKINNPDCQDDAVLQIPNGLSIPDFIYHCKMMRGENRPQLLTRSFIKSPSVPNLTNDVTDGLRVLNLDTVSQTCSAPRSSSDIRLLQWNILSQSLGQYNDGFVSCPEEALTWECRKYQILQEIIHTNPDVICLQEVDHFKFLQTMLSTQGYDGVFFPKPDSPCLYIEENNGPDGCAIFYRRSKFELLSCMTRVLEVWRVQSNQVAIAAVLRVLESGYEFCLSTTHLKARHGALLSKLRNEQGKDLLRFTKDVAQGRPILLCGDFNAEPCEPVYSTIINNKDLGLSSAYAEILSKSPQLSGQQETKQTNNADAEEDLEEEAETPTRADKMASHEPEYTTWKIREDGEVCHCIDYVFFTRDHFHVENCLMFPQANEVGKNRVPSFQYPSDHFSLVCDFKIRNEDDKSSPVED